MNEKTAQDALASCKAALPAAILTDGTAITSGNPFLDFDCNRWVPEDQLMEALQKETGSRPDAQELETAMLAIGSRRKIFRTSRWAGQQYAQTVVAAWFADRPLDRTEEPA